MKLRKISAMCVILINSTDIFYTGVSSLALDNKPLKGS